MSDHLLHVWCENYETADEIRDEILARYPLVEVDYRGAQVMAGEAAVEALLDDCMRAWRDTLTENAYLDGRALAQALAALRGTEFAAEWAAGLRRSWTTE